MNNFDTSAIDWSALTHLSIRTVVIQPDGTIKQAITRENLKKLVDEAHQHGVRAMILVWGTKPEASSEYLAHNQDRAVESLLTFVRENNLDGLDMDDESWRERNTVTGESNRELVTSLFRKLNASFKAARADYQIFWASPPVIDPSDRYTAAWPDYKAIADLIDGFAIMTYTVSPPSIGWTTSMQPVAGGGKVNGHARDLTTTIRDYLAATGGRADKLLLGVATRSSLGGAEWDCKTGEPGARIIGKWRRLTAEQAATNAQQHGRLFDVQQKSPWYRYASGDQWVQGWYEDDESLAAKYDLARELNLQGVCIWVLDGSHEPRSTFSLLETRLQGK
jgi:spore germination protein YaaH